MRPRDMPQKTTHTSIGVLIGIVVAGLSCEISSCEISSSGTDRKAKKKQLQAFSHVSQGDYVAGIDQRARQVIADRYRGRIEPGVGCDVCPDMCTMADLRPLSVSKLRHEYRQALLDEYAVGDGLVEFPRDRPLGLALVLGEYTTPDSLSRRTAFYENRRLSCILNQHKSMKNEVYRPLLDPREHRMVRYQAALAMSLSSVGIQAARRTLSELAQGTDAIAKFARSTIRVMDRDGWGDEAKE